MSIFEAWRVAAAVVFAAILLLWLVSLLRRDVSIIDIFWGFGFVLVAWVGRVLSGEPDGRQLLFLALVTLWGGRLTFYLLVRNWGKEEDYRYRAMRRTWGGRFPWVSLWTVFVLQGILIVSIGLPLLWGQVKPGPETWRASDVLAVAFWLIGFVFEAVGDWQLARFKSDPANQGKVLRSGLWAWTRHPNYFGDMMVWWGFFLLALASPGGLWTLPCPILMTFFLLRVSGVALLERTIGERRPEYRDYIESTSAFFPWPPRRRAAR